MTFAKSIFLVFMLIFLSVTVSPAYADPPLPTPVGRVIWIKGSLKAVMPNNEQRLLQKMSVIYRNDILITDNQSKAQIAFTDNSLITFAPNTKFYIADYAFSPKAKKGAVKYIMNLLEGGLRTITGLVAKKDPDAYQVNTPVATIGVRGTDYAVFVSQDKIFIGYYAGVPCVQNKKGKLCLGNKLPYAEVADSQTAPVPVSQRPDVFNEKLEITPATISSFDTAAVQAAQTTNPVPRKNPTGVFNSFCITQ